MRLQYTYLKSTQPSYRALIVVLVALAVLGYGAAHYMDVNGHHVTGMSNQVVWGLPHVFALSLILAASGALNVASLWSVFAIRAYQPLARLSALLAVALLFGGLLILVLDLGRPDRLIIAMTHYNFKSVFAWNIFLYVGFVAVVVGYLYSQFEPHLASRRRAIGVLALLWRLILTCGSGAIFAFLVARPAYHSAILIPLFIALSLSLGTAIFLLVAITLTRWHGPYLSEHLNTPARDDVLPRLAKLLALFIGVVIFLTLIFHATHLYAAEQRALERFILLEGGILTILFWLVQLGLGGVASLGLLAWYLRAPSMRGGVLASAAALVVLGGFAQLYVIIIGGQAFPMTLFPGKTVTSSFFDGQVATYSPSLPEWLLGLGGVSVALLVLLLVMRVLPFLPHRQTLAARVVASPEPT